MSSSKPRATVQKNPGAESSQPVVDRARVLVELLKEHKAGNAVAPLIKDARHAAGLTPMEQTKPAPEALRNSARELLKRIGRKTTPTLPRARGMMSPEVLRTTIAALVDGKRLSQEHPAVIAIVIENQPRSTQSAVMRALPGRTARQVRRALMSLS